MEPEKRAREKRSTAAVQDRVYFERVAMVMTTTPLAVMAIVVAVVCLTILMRPYTDPFLLYGWGSLMLGIAGLRQWSHLRFRNFRRFHKERRLEAIRIWDHRCVLFSLLTGVGWGIGALLFIPTLPVQEHLILTLVYVAYLSGGLTTQFPLPVAFAVLFYPIMVPLCAMLFAIPGRPGQLMGLMLIVFTLFVVSAARRLHRQLAKTLAHRFSNEELVAQLRREQETIRRLNRSLEKEIRDREQQARQLEEALREADQANRAKTLFLANMSHDIRTPMTSILGITQLLQESEEDEQKKRLIDDVKGAADGLLGLLNDILDFSKIEAGQLLIEQHPFNLRETLEKIYAIMEYGAREKGLDFRIDLGRLQDRRTLVLGDELRLRQILINLVSNAIKFTERGRVTLTAELTGCQGPGEQGIQVLFTVRDTGIGIPAELKERIFDVFAQADSSLNRRYGGSGLGLAISSRLVRLMAGRLWCESEEGVGSAFHVELKFGEVVGELNEQDEGAEPPVPRELRILLVEDNPANRNLGRMLLERDGHTVLVAEDGHRALVVLADQKVDLVLMDLQMPEMDGLTATGIIRAVQSGDSIDFPELEPLLQERLVARWRGKRPLPIIAMTAHAMRGDQKKCLKAGMDGYLTKPFEPSQIRKMILEAVDKSGEEQETQNL